MSSDKKETGKHGEELACRILKKHGLKIVEKNYRFHALGEIDIIARDGSTLVFIEVKCRRNLKFGDPEYSISPHKARQVRKIAECYLFEKHIKETDCRFDVVTVLELEKNEPVVNYIPNAF